MMKKLLKSVTLLALIVSMIGMLTACGKEKENTNEDKSKGDILVATRIFNDGDVKIKETVEINFEADKALIVYEYEDEEIAAEYYEYMDFLFGGSAKQSGKKVTISTPVEDFRFTNSSEKITMEQIQADLEEEGYEISFK